MEQKDFNIPAKVVLDTIDEVKYLFAHEDAVSMLEDMAGEQLCIGEVFDAETLEWIRCGALPTYHRGLYCDQHKGM